MIFTQPIILASEFIQHLIVIVLAGLVLSECVACYRDLQMSRKGLLDIEKEKRFRVRKREHLQLLAAVILSALWLIVEYFANLSIALYHLLFHVPVVLAILWFIRQITRPYNGLLTFLFYALLVAAGGHIFLDVFKFLLNMHIVWDPISRAMLKTTKAILLYFLVIYYMVISDK